MNIMKRGLPFLLIFVMLLSGMSFAVSEPISFEDVSSDSWYYEGVTTMAEYGIITGYPDGKFLPSKEVTREEFAVMMVRALKLGKSGSDSSFEDIEDDYWAVPYIESAKLYLTGYKTNTGISFKPKFDTVREDMAVALVKALGYSTSNANLSLLNKFKDRDQISENLKPYVAIAFEKKLINGALKDDGLYFNPKQSLTRAEAAVLLLAVIKEEKITFDEEKVVIEDNEYKATKLRVEVEDDVAYLKWNEINHDDFEGYKLVVTRYDSTPSYPDNGALRFFDDEDVTRYQIKPGQKVSGSDFVKIEDGEKYYAAITTLYKDGKKTSNVVNFELDEEAVPSYIRPSLRIENDGDQAKLYWTQVKHPNFKYYKVVVSAKDSTPSYPDNGYMYAISNYKNNSSKIKIGSKGNNSDFSKIIEGEKYYVSISAVYTDKTFTSNVVSLQLTDETDEDYVTPTLSLNDQGDSVLLDWNKIDHDDFKGYKVVVSKTDDSPVYPANGYMKYITDKDKTAFEIKVGDKAYNADFVKIEKGQWYYAAISALYDDGTVVSNTVKFKIDEEVSDDYITPNLVLRSSGDTVELDWNKIDHPDFEGYKVVVSEENDAPQYPEDGYMKYITNKDETNFYIDKGDKAYNADFNGIEYGEEYSASITVIYKGGKTFSNTVKFELEEEEKNYIEPVLSLDMDDDMAKLSWTRIDHEDFEGYKVVVSSDNDAPSYPNDGYMAYITDNNQADYEISVGDKAYNADFREIEENQKYFVSISVIYKDNTVTGNVEDFNFEVEIEEEEEVIEEEEALITPVVEISTQVEAGVEFEWTTIDHASFQGYKLVVSKDNASPSYPADGYMAYITDKDANSYVVELGDAPQNGDFQTIEENVTYNVSITAIYGDDSVTSLPVSFTLGE